jgi:siroheme synthase
VVQKGTLPDQKVLIATLDTLAEVAGRERIETPALVIAGEVVLLSSFSSAPAASLQPPTWKTTTSL